MLVDVIYIFFLACSWWQHATNLASYEQQDAHEFFISTLDAIHEMVGLDHWKSQSTCKIFALSKKLSFFTFCFYYLYEDRPFLSMDIGSLGFDCFHFKGATFYAAF